MAFPKPTDASSLQGVPVSGLAPAAGALLEYQGASASWVPTVPPAPTAPVTAQLAADLAVVAATLTEVLSIQLGVGQWLVTASLTAVNGAATAALLEADLLAGTATATFGGGQSASSELPALLAGSRALELAALVTVTVAGTVLLDVECANACTVKAATPGYAFPGATGIVATPIA